MGLLLLLLLSPLVSAVPEALPLLTVVSVPAMASALAGLSPSFDGSVTLFAVVVVVVVVAVSSRRAGGAVSLFLLWLWTANSCRLLRKNVVDPTLSFDGPVAGEGSDDSSAAVPPFEFVTLVSSSLSEALVVGKGGGTKTLGFFSFSSVGSAGRVALSSSTSSSGLDENLRG